MSRKPPRGLPNILRNRALSRRSLLRGVASSGAMASLGLPWLDAMRPALSRKRSVPEVPPFVAFVFAPNGMDMDAWYGRTEGVEPLLGCLQNHAQRLLVPHNLRLRGAFALGDGPGDHARAAAAYLTTAHPFKTGGSDIKNGVSVDQVFASAWEGSTPFRSLELGMQRGRTSGACDSGYACAYSSHIAWRDAATPIPAEVHPRDVFTRLFGEPDELLDPEVKARRDQARRSVLDVVADQAKELRRVLGRQDRDRVDQYLQSIRDLEKRLDSGGEEAAVEAPAGLRDMGYERRVGVMYELMTLALQSRQTRVTSFMLGNAGSSMTYRWLGVPERHHYLSHHKGDPDKIAKIRKINRWHVEQFKGFLDRMATIETPSGPLLDQGTVMLGSGIADGNRHNHSDLPVLLAGGMGGKVPTGKALDAAPKTSMGDLYVSLLRAGGVQAESFGDSKGALFG